MVAFMLSLKLTSFCGCITVEGPVAFILACSPDACASATTPSIFTTSCARSSEPISSVAASLLEQLWKKKCCRY
ncbi:hypothetical protein NV63_03495 [Elizabethkingia anophelis]|nr:hypothetical protein NV63_03495 [Elizabethkingia anophelis]